jgi:hypothetical protein
LFLSHFFTSKRAFFAYLMLFLSKIYRDHLFNTVKKLLFLFLFFIGTAFVVNNDSLKAQNKTSPLKYYTVSQFEYTDSVSYLNNSLLDFQNYLPKNTLGNSGLAYNDFIYKKNTPFGFNYNKNYFQNYFYTPSNLKFYNTRIPYTDLFAVFGSKKEQFFKMALSYNIKKNWNVTVNFSRIKSIGFYEHQKADHTFLAVSSNYKTLNNRYMLLASAAFNKIKNEVNGGMEKDSISGAYNELLASARNSESNVNVFLKQYINLGQRMNDTSPIIPTSRFILTSVMDQLGTKYVDPDPNEGHYEHYYYARNTNDTSTVFKLENELAWKRVDNLKRGFTDAIGFGASVKHQFVHVQQRKMDTSLSNFSVGAELSNLFSKNKCWWKLNGNYAVQGYNKNDYAYALVVTKAFRDSLTRFTIHLKTTEHVPDFMYNEYASNHFKWSNHFEKVKEQTAGANFLMDKYDLALGIDFTAYTNVLYFDTAAIARQYEGTVQVLSVVLKKNISFHNWHLNNKITYQHVPDSSVIRVPQFILQHSLYYENDVFKNALRLQIGFAVFYNTAFYSNAFMPVTNQFYMQNKSKYGDYPIIDFFLNAKIKVVNIFFKIDHLNSGFMGTDYMLTPNYLLSPRAFKIGVSWKFWD